MEWEICRVRPGDMLRALLRRPFCGVVARDDPFSQGKVRPPGMDMAEFLLLLAALRRAVRGCSKGNWARVRRGEGVRARRHLSGDGEPLRRLARSVVRGWGEATCGVCGALRRGVARGPAPEGFFAEAPGAPSSPSRSRLGVRFGLERCAGVLPFNMVYSLPSGWR